MEQVKPQTQAQIKSVIAENMEKSGLPQVVADAVANKNLADKILSQMTELSNRGELYFPKGYNVGNALKLAYSDIVSKGYQKLEPLSVANALVEMAVQGLDRARNQCYFLTYDNQTLIMQRSYFGDVCACKQTGLITDVYAVPIYKGDVFEMGFDEHGRRCVKHHEQKFENLDNEIIGGYAVAVGINGYKMYEIMTMKEIKKSWEMSKLNKAKKYNTFQQDFAQEATKRTCIRRLVKMIFNTTPSNSLDDEQRALINSFIRSTEDEFDNQSEERKYIDANEVKQIIEESVNTKKVENPFEKKESEKKKDDFEKFKEQIEKAMQDNNKKVNADENGEVNNVEKSIIQKEENFIDDLLNYES